MPNAKQRLLIVEDEDSIARGLEDLFTFKGFDVTCSADGKAGYELALRSSFDAVILDVMLPNMDGFAICDALRQHAPDQAIIMLTAKNAEEDIINGLSSGADDYISKPFSVRELVLRVESVLRRSGKSTLPEKLDLGHGISVDTSNLKLRVRGEVVNVTKREVELLRFLRLHYHQPVSREDLLHHVWGYKNTSVMDTRTVDIHIAKLRKKIEKDARQPRLLLTIRGRGYKWQVENPPL